MTEVEKIKEAQMLRDEDSFTRARREAYEVQEMRDRLAKVEAESASRTRNRLEKGSPSSARRDFAGMLNALVVDSASRELPGLAALESVRKRQQLGYKTAADHNRAYEKFEKSESFNRLLPASLTRSRFEIGPRDPGNWDGSRFEADEPYVSPLCANRVPDAGGELISEDRRARDHWPSGEPEVIQAAWLLEAARALILAARERARNALEGRHDDGGRSRRV